MSNMGVDQISTALGGAMAGGMAGVIAGALLGIRLRPRGHLLVATLAPIATIAVVFLAIAIPSWGGVRSKPHSDVSPTEASLFGPALPAGFHYRDDFITRDEEEALVEAIGRTDFSDFEMHGVVARRRVAFFGATYDASLDSVPTIPDFLLGLRAAVAGWAGVNAEDFAMALINEYRPGAPIGWHRDAPQYDIVAGVSLLSSCRMRFRPYVSPAAHSASRGPRRTATHEVVLTPRSAYLITGEARSGFEHSIPAVAALRYSITFRTLRLAAFRSRTQ
jgi:alkylated DNA repair dioxygenase AlkB